MARRVSKKQRDALKALEDVHTILRHHLLNVFPEGSHEADRVDRMLEDIGVLGTAIENSLR